MTNMETCLRLGHLLPEHIAGVALRVGDSVVLSSRKNIEERAETLFAPWKNPKYKGNKLLYLTGNLSKSIYRKLLSLTPSGAEITYGSIVVYAGIQYHGGRGILARPYLDIIAQDMKNIEKEAEKLFEKVLNA